ncbi:hypothetical protein [Halorarius litoreus]|uniref:hypothetical protein n=1 Tax=Halorarius litoreus TaxID=2962676 RepID=UPI0020CC2C5F|nr:hypothetical protein [Halorarius litoreus]
MEFETHIQESTFHSPLADFEEVTETIEVRTDPLTGRTARIADGAFATPDDYDIDSVVSDAEGCFFCPGTVEEATPTYPEWMDVERGSWGEATSFPNLNPYAAHSNVVALTETHFQPMEAFTPRQFADGLNAALEFVHAAFDHDETAQYASVNMNFLKSAGSSIVHPHMQALVDDRGTNEGRRLAEAAADYRSREGSDYWQDLVDAERDGERWIGETGPVDWLAAFAPKHHRHVLGVVDREGVPSPDGAAVDGISEGLTHVLASYAEAGLNAFNVAIHLTADHQTPVVNVIARSVFDEYYWSDSPYFTVLHDEGVVTTAPEAYAADAHEQF